MGCVTVVPSSTGSRGWDSGATCIVQAELDGLKSVCAVHELLIRAIGLPFVFQSAVCISLTSLQ